MKVSLVVIAILMIAIGGVFAGQGLGYIPGSFMTGDIHWFWIGSAMIVVGIADILLVFTILRRLTPK